MSGTFTKLFSSITASTVWCRPSDTRVVWITMLAMADRHGRVWASIPGLAKEAAVSVEACRTAIDEFLSPDPDSRTKVAEGRRIEPIDGGWRLINHAKYRAIRDEEERKAYKAEKQREYRRVDNVDKSGQRGPQVDSGAHNAEAEAEAKVQRPAPKAWLLPLWVDSEAWKGFEEMRRKIRAPLTDRGRNGIIKELQKLCSAGDNAAAILDQSTQNSWRSVFPLRESMARANKTPPNPGAQQTVVSDEEAYLTWQSTSPEYRKANPWEER